MRVERLQDQGAAEQDKHVYQDAGERRRANLRGHRTPSGRRRRPTGDSLRRPTLHPDQSQSTSSRQQGAGNECSPSVSQSRSTGRPSSPGRLGPFAVGDDRRRGPRADEHGRAGRRAEGRDDQAHPGRHRDVHRDAGTGPRPGVRSDRVAGRRRKGSPAHRRLHRDETGCNAIRRPARTVDHSTSRCRSR